MRGSVGVQTFHWFSVLPLSTVSVILLQLQAFVVLPPLVKVPSISLIQTHVPSFNLSSTIRASVRTLDRIRVFRRRQDSPSRSPDDREPRERSPGWFLRMHRNMSSSKRSRSSSTQPEIPSEADHPEPVPQSPTARDQGADGLSKMPAFLQQSPSGRCPKVFMIVFLALANMIT